MSQIFELLGLSYQQGKRAGQGCVIHVAMNETKSIALLSFSQQETTWAAADFHRRCPSKTQPGAVFWPAWLEVNR